MSPKQEHYYGLGMDGLVSACSRSTDVIMVFGHGCTGKRMLSKHERYCGLRMDGLVTLCSRNTNVIMVWAWMHWQAYAFETQTLFPFGHGCTGNRMLSRHERYYGLGMDAAQVNGMLSKHERYHSLGMDALVAVCSRNMKVCYSLSMDALVIVCSWSTSGTMMPAAWTRWTAEIAAYTG